MSWVDDTIKRVRDFDRSRPRSTQTAVGWSEVGGCRAALGFRLREDFVTDDPDTWAAQRGTALHEYLAPILAEPGDRVEMETEYRGIPGHADLVGPDYVTDLKTTTLATAKLWAADHSLLHPKLIQANGYGAGLIDAGELPADSRVRLLVIPVDGKFADWWGYEETFNRALADEGAARLDEVRERMARGEALPKDKPYAFCRDWCLAGETEVVTANGIFPIRELAGSSHSLLVPSSHGHGQWQSCEVRSLGQQPLIAITLRRLKTSKTIYATADHRWVAKDGAILRTADLRAGRQLRSIRRNSTTELAEVPFAVAQGFVYGDGSLPGAPGTAVSLPLYDNSPKPKSMLGYFAAHDVRRVARDDQSGGDGWLVPMLPRTWKAAPDLNETRSFLVSWLAGYIAADGSVSAAGQTTISSSRRECLDLVRSVCAITGIGYSPVQVRSRIGYGQTEPSNLYSVALRTRDLPEWVFKHEHHQQRAGLARDKKAHDLAWVVESVSATDRVEEVFCAMVPGANAFALADELLTRNCPFFSLCRTSDDPKAGEPITDPELIAAIAAYGEATKQQTALKKQKDGLAAIIRGLRGSTPEWRISLGAGGDPSWELDEDWIRADYASRGEDVPVIEKPGSAPRMTVTRIEQKAATTTGETNAA